MSSTSEPTHWRGGLPMGSPGWAIVSLILTFLSPPAAAAIEPPILLKEAAGTSVPGAPIPCSLPSALTGTCANLHYYNVCSGYVWMYGWGSYEFAGTQFRDPCIAPGNRVNSVITYYRNLCPGYSQTFDVYLDVDTDSDGCPDYNLAVDARLDPAMRWNCSPLSNPCIPLDAQALIIRLGRSEGTSCGSLVTDGAYSSQCDPVGTLHSFYYGVGGQDCIPWRGPGGRFDNFLFWLTIDNGCPPTGTEPVSWGSVKRLFQ